MITLHFIYNRSTNMNYFIYTSQRQMLKQLFIDKIWWPRILSSMLQCFYPVKKKPVVHVREQEMQWEQKPTSLNVSTALSSSHKLLRVFLWLDSNTYCFTYNISLRISVEKQIFLSCVSAARRWRIVRDYVTWPTPTTLAQLVALRSNSTFSHERWIMLTSN